jgi:predicted phosphodiesterase
LLIVHHSPFSISRLADFFSILLESVIELAGLRVAIRRIPYEGGKLTKDGRAFLEREQPDICVFGHTHQSKTDWHGSTLLFNPGSAGPKRFTLLRGLASSRLRAVVSSPP